MKFSEVPAEATFVDVDGIPVVQLPGGNCIAFEKGAPDAESRPYPNQRKAGTEGDLLSREEFQDWLSSGVNRFDVAR